MCVQLYFSPCGYPVVQTSFIEKSIIYLVLCTAPYFTRSLSMNAWVWAFPLVYLAILPIPCCLNYYSVQIGLPPNPTFSSLSSCSWPLQSYTNFRIRLSSSMKKSVEIFNWDCIVYKSIWDLIFQFMNIVYLSIYVGLLKCFSMSFITFSIEALHDFS